MRLVGSKTGIGMGKKGAGGEGAGGERAVDENGSFTLDVSMEAYPVMNEFIKENPQALFPKLIDFGSCVICTEYAPSLLPSSLAHCYYPITEQERRSNCEMTFQAWTFNSKSLFLRRILIFLYIHSKVARFTWCLVTSSMKMRLTTTRRDDTGRQHGDHHAGVHAAGDVHIVKQGAAGVRPVPVRGRCHYHLWFCCWA